jgi:iron(III) transport system ATP-binding protein
VLEVADLRKRFTVEHGEVRALDGVAFGVPEGRLLTLLGPSGCGKTTTLRSVAGLERPDQGTVVIGGQVVFSLHPERFVPTERRSIGMVFQSYAIWPHMTVFENVAYPLQALKLSGSQVRERVRNALAMVDLEGLEERPAPQLSGGQQQRVALARALVGEPKLLLLDEPLSNLDARLRQQMRVEIRQLQQRAGVTAVYVTHDQEEALAVSDEIVFMHNGRIVERGHPEELYMRPQERLTAEFLGEANFLPGQVTSRNGEHVVVRTGGGTLVCTSRPGLGTEVSVFFRPESPRIERHPPSDGYFLQGTVERTLFLGKAVTCWLRVGQDQELRVSAPPVTYPRVGEQVYLVLAPEASAVFA